MELTPPHCANDFLDRCLVKIALFFSRSRRTAGRSRSLRPIWVYGWFTEGFDTLDLKEAKKVLDELHA